MPKKLSKVQKKSLELGMCFNRANRHLQRSIVEKFFRQRDGDNCYRCGQIILPGDRFHVDHKKTWIEAGDMAILAFMDINNCAMSHVSCNTSHGSNLGKSKNEILDSLNKIKDLSVHFE